MKSLLLRLAQLWGVSLRDSRILIAIAIAYGFARTSGGNFPHLLLYTFLGLLILSAFWVRYSSGMLRVVYEPAHALLLRGQDLPVALLVYNEGFLPTPWLQISDCSQPDRSHSCQLPPLVSLRLSYRIEQLKRGRYHPGPVALQVRDPFGFFVATRHFPSARAITVYPPLLTWHIDLPLAQSYGQTRTRRPTTTDPSGLVGIRDFRSGDNPKHIDWKATARHYQLQVKEFELEATGLLSVYLNLSSTDYRSDDQLELAVDATAALVTQALRQGFEVRLFAQDSSTHYLTPARGEVGIRACLELLVDVQATHRGSFARVVHADLAHAPPEASLILITPCLDASSGELLRQVSRRGRSSMLVLVDDDAPNNRLLYDNLTVYRVDRKVQPHLLWKGGVVYAKSK